MQNQIGEIKELALNLSDGETKTYPCVFCRAEHEATMAVTREGNGLMYYCFRASCHRAGHIGKEGHTRVSGKKRTFTPRVFTGETGPLSVGQIVELKDTYGIRLRMLRANRVRYCEREGRLVFPLFSPRGERTGYVTKLWTPSSYRKKAMTYWEQDVPKVHWPRPTSRFTCLRPSDAKPLVIVEDALSSIKVSEVARCACILGTGMSGEVAMELAKHTSHVIFMLDNDAIALAHNMAKKYAFLFSSTVIPMKQDPKDTPFEELKELLL